MKFLKVILGLESACRIVFVSILLVVTNKRQTDDRMIAL